MLNQVAIMFFELFILQYFSFNCKLGYIDLYFIPLADFEHSMGRGAQKGISNTFFFLQHY